MLGDLRGDIGLTQNLLQAQHRHQRGVLQQRKPQIADSWYREPPGLRQTDAEKDLSARHAEREPRLDLPRRHGQKGAAKSLRSIRAEHDSKRQNAGRELARRPVAKDLRCAEIEDQQDQELRQAAQQIQHGGDGHPDPAMG